MLIMYKIVVVFKLFAVAVYKIHQNNGFELLDRMRVRYVTLLIVKYPVYTRLKNVKNIMTDVNKINLIFQQNDHKFTMCSNSFPKRHPVAIKSFVELTSTNKIISFYIEV